MRPSPFAYLWLLLPVGTADAQQTVELEEVVITASLRGVTVGEFPASVTVLDAAELQGSAVQHLEEVLGRIPSLSWAGASSRPRYFQLRGIGELEQYQGAPNPSVGFLLDDIDFSGIGMVATLFDVEQVEVLRGPQGTRFGANALAGLIQVRTRDPQPVSERGVEASLGGDAFRSLGATAGGALGDVGSAWRLAVQQASSDGFRRNAYLGRSDTNGRDELTARAKIHLALGEGLSLDLALLHLDLDNGYDAFAIDNTYRTLADRPGRDAQRTSGASVDLRWDRGARQWRSLTTLADSSIESSFDGDWGNPDAWGEDGPYDFFSRTLRERTTWSQDLRLAGIEADGLEWVAGAYLLGLEEDNRQRDDGLYLEFPYERALDSRYRALNLAAYGEIAWPLGDSTVLTTGLRLERRDADYADSDGLEFTAVDDLWGGQLALVHQWSSDVSLWASLSRGYKAGGFNIGIAVPEDRTAFDPEYLWAAEVGLRGGRPGGPQVDVSVFHLRREAQQVATSFQLDPQDPLTFVYLTDNSARGRALGLEASLSWSPSEWWQFSAGLSASRSEYLGYRFGERTLDGRDWAHSPRLQYSLAATWRDPRGLHARLDLSGQDDFYYDASHDQRSRPYQLLHLRAGYTSAAWSVEAWVRNLLDERYPVRGFYFGNEPPDFPERLYLRLGDPRQVGVTVRFKW
ncbi:MAG: TonB-dependent receptor [Steroidobacteraceae bacterium]